MWRQLNREGIGAAKCTLERLMAAEGLHGIVRGASARNTRPDPAAARPEDLVERWSRTERPDQLSVVDFTDAPAWA